MFALQNEIEESEAKKIVDLYKNKVYPGIPRWHESTQASLRKSRTLYNCFGRKCYFMGALDRDTFKQGYAFVPQSTVFDVARLAMIGCLDDSTPVFEHADLLAQVHDFILTQYLLRDFHLMAQFVIRIAYDYMRPTLNYGEPFHLGVDAKCGFAWNAKMIGLSISEDVDQTARNLEEVWDKLHALHAARSTKKEKAA